jgi:hypothetical protein
MGRLGVTDLSDHFLDVVRLRFEMYKKLGDGTLAQLSAEDLGWQPNGESNSVAVIVQHLHGNMVSRWTEFLTSDGEKASRDRDGEFVAPARVDRETLMAQWEAGWACLFGTLDSLSPADLMREVTVRNQPLSVLDAIVRQLAHVAGHVGQMQWIGKARLGAGWKPLSIPRGESRNTALIEQHERRWGGLRS